jgi:hypothetical protein
MIEIRGRLAWLLGDKISPRHSAADRPNLILVPSPRQSRYEINVNSLVQFWRAAEDDEIGGWCVVVHRPGTPATGNPSLADFVSKQHAEHIAELHNEWLGRRVRNKA